VISSGDFSSKPAAEIAKLEWQMVLTATAQVGQSIELEDRVARRNTAELSHFILS
jgi:hypothetical protein